MKPIQNTVFGGHGFIGAHLCNYLEKGGLPYQVVGRQDPLPKGSLGNVFYCAGITADFRSRPFETMNAHISTLSNVLEHGQYTTFLYLSSARMYRHASLTMEDVKFVIDPNSPEDLVDISKLAGESLCLSIDNENIRILRLSNVFGNDFFSKNFLTEIIKSALVDRKIHLQSGLDSSKDYVDVDSVVNVMCRIAESGASRIYNVASGYNISHKEIVLSLRDLTGCSLTVVGDAPSIIWPIINNHRIRQEFNFKPSRLTDKLESLVNKFETIFLKN